MKHTRSARRLPAANARRGIATLWLILALPVMLIMLCAAVEIGNVWLARVELESALEAAALAGVHEWKDGGTTSAARLCARSLGGANDVRGMTVVLDLNEGTGPNENDKCNGDIILGRIEGDPDSYIFNADEEPGGAEDFGVRAQQSKMVPLVCSNLFGSLLPSFTVSAKADAMFESSGSPKLIRVATFICTD